MFLLELPIDRGAAKAELVLEKISRPPASPRITRPRLLTILDQSLSSCAATVISGRAGSGKTALAVDFSRNCGRRTSWYKVDAPECELRVFFQYLIASIQRRRPGFGKQTLYRSIAAFTPTEVPSLAESFVYELAEGEDDPLLIVIEDLHLICDSDWLVPFFRRLLPLLPSDVHMLLTSRTMVPAPLWRMRSKQMLVVVDEESLAFNRAEARELFESYGLNNEQANIALDHTRGRAGALASFAASISATNGKERQNSEQH